MTINKRIYWTITGLTAAFMLLASIPDVLVAPGAVAIFQHLGTPLICCPFWESRRAPLLSCCFFLGSHG